MFQRGFDFVKAVEMMQTALKQLSANFNSAADYR